LDQFLEHLIEIGIERVIRIGGQSKSKVLEGKNLRVVSQGEAKTKSERYQVAKTYEELSNKEQLINKALIGPISRVIYNGDIHVSTLNFPDSTRTDSRWWVRTHLRLGAKG
jgi:hypothetical protein